MYSLLLFGGSALIFLFLTILSSALILLINYLLNKRIRFEFRREGTGDPGPAYEPAEKRLEKLSGFKPDRVIIYGQNTFAYNARKKKIYIQTYMEPDGISLCYRDIISVEIFEADASDKTQCEALRLKIRTRKPGYAGIELPYLSVPEDRSGFAYASASGAAKEVKTVLEGL